MKIVCDNCATKYSIADEKVRGKVFKIRCKKCSHIIVVRGNDGAGAPAQAESEGAGADGFPGDEPATTVAAGGSIASGGGGSDAVWHLVIDREQVGPLTVAEVRAKFAAGEIDVETYAWREGFGDWLRLGSIDDFRDLGAGAPAPQDTEGATRRTDAADLFAQSGHDEAAADAGADLFGGGAAAAQPAAAAASNSDAFAASAGGAGGLFGAPESAPAPAARPARQSSPGFAGGGMSAGGAAAEVASDAAGMKGQRNENSVLFSLNNLQALASGSGPAPAAPKPGVDNRPGFANSQTEGSGLIDIRAMAASTLSAPASGPSGKQNDEPVFSAPVFSPMAAPILMPAAPSGPPKWLWPVIGLGVVSLLGIVVIGVLLLTRKPPEVVATNTPAAGAATAAAPTAAAPTAAAPTAAAPTAAAPTAAAPTEAKATTPDPAKADGSKHDKKHDKAAAAPGKHETKAVADATPAPAAAPAPAAKPAKKGGKDALDDLLDGASPDDKPKHAAKAESSGGGDDSLPDTLDKSAIVAGMGKVKPRVSSCYDQFKVPGLANVAVTIGKSGSVKSANVSGTFAGTPTGSCVERAVKGASFSKFKGSDVTITYPFVLR